jgi:mannose-6-phosphate isomerase-like protein (cupin superfamily)
MTEKPWGYEEILLQNEKFVVKRLFIRGGHRTSLQKHSLKHEAMLILLGKGVIGIGDSNTWYDTKHKVFAIPTDIMHRITATKDTELIEVSTPELDDVIRLEDDYGRIG